METIIILLKMLLYGVLGYYFIKVTTKNSEYIPMKSIFSPSFILFSLVGMFSGDLGVVFTFIIGVLWSLVIKAFVSLIYKKNYFNDHIFIFGLINLLNVYVIEKALNWFIHSSEFESILILFSILFIMFILDISYTLRSLNQCEA